ncbi:hypothetical protein DCAR_0933479 [Daucus carota subsp. sativus]|uniref:Uncharacterized protein n=1 Tax=Daucus carota subsp. sativus TaxID=79200 RepID=A0A175YD21_DAUCS|nr:PREDICTED: uncharacterized protein LOC108201873 [Daucus carota subsp. sativus]WOH13965.1 hypothetical protein DCAR_0933479 [Daucus carota subsp. sativus]
MADWIRPVTLSRLWNRCYNLFSSSDFFISTINTIKDVLSWSGLFIISLLIGIWIKLAITGLASFLPGDVPSWKTSWTVGIAIFTFSCYCLEECLKMKRAQLARALLDPSRRNNIEFRNGTVY